MIDHIPQKVEKSTYSLILNYFQRIKAGDVRGLLNLFTDDSVVYEPFSKSKCLVSKLEIESFLKTVVMANEGMEYKIRIESEEQSGNTNKVVTLVTFQKGDAIRSRFTFEIERADELIGSKIKTLRIEFIDM
ncbi:MAG TPA: nuclear transport factor 2 family protein [Nitrososphaeraceae archaeon]